MLSRSSFVITSLLAGTLSLQRSAFAQKTYLIEESTDFTGNGCQNSDVNTITSSLQSELNANGWTGSRFVNSAAWPKDFIESCSTTYVPSSASPGTVGTDHVWADNKTLTVYAGHGNQGLLQWGYSNSNLCTITFQPNMRLGSMGGARSGFAMYLTSFTLKVTSLVSQANWQWEQQQFGFDNSPAIASDSPKLFYVYSAAYGNNKASWLDVMEDDMPIWDLGGDSPVVVTYGRTSSECTTFHDNLALTETAGLTPRGGGPSCGQGQPSFFYCFTWIDN